VSQFSRLFAQRHYESITRVSGDNALPWQTVCKMRQTAPLERIMGKFTLPDVRAWCKQQFPYGTIYSARKK